MIRDIILLIYTFGLGIIFLMPSINGTLDPNIATMCIASIPVFYLTLALPEIFKPNSKAARFLTKKII